ncbi:hypothetical protein KY290_016322 [Solanum tuberosum]|uniref:Protein kinase domain-containing protein n=1 Tax=Solanum tuberosum TaxID=4113 RepID=A0ABQ7VUX2_SOLTU|nr:hypothetical protein KY289_014471 [Solanum tuberosum]KAH0772341.1 hypothetical protein KY290_016322 [Solanum tuberosum]
MNISTNQSSLLALKSHITSDPFHVLSTNWSSSTSVCDWIEITCSSRHQRVIALNISNMGLSGTIPPQLGNLSFLVSLDLSKNDFCGELPSEFSHLRRLRVIKLSYINFTGEISIGIAPLPSLIRFSMGYNKLLNGSNVLSKFNISTLEYLDLRNSGLTGDFPSDLCHRLPRLQKLALGNNMLSGEVPRNISECSELHLLMLFQNNFVGTIPRDIGTIPDEIGHLYNLKNIFMDKNYLTGSIPLTLFNISSLEMLYMNDNKLEGPLPRQVGNLTMLAWFDLSNNYLAGVIPHEVGNLQELTDLPLSYNEFSGSIPIGIFNISSLVTIGLTENHISGNLPSTIGNGLPNVEKLFLGGNNINGVLPGSISNLSKLTFLEIFSNEFTGSIPDSLGNLRQLELLNLYGNSFTSELSFITPLANCKHLRILILSFNPLNAMLPRAIGNISSLQSFIARCRLITGPFPIVLCELPNLGILSLSQNKILGHIPSCLGNMTSLREVYLDSNNFTTSIPSSLWNLKDILKLNLSSNSFNGSLPLEVGNLKAALLLDLSRNQISGNIPSTLGGLQKLIQLSLAHNRIEGSIPDTFGELLSLEALDLSYNKMSGVIPKSLEALNQLNSFNVSFNRLHGEIPSGGPFLNLPYQSFMSNKGLCGNPQKHVPACPSYSKNQSKSKKRNLIWIIVTSSVISVIGLASAIVFMLMRRGGKTINAEVEWSPEVAPQRFSYYALQRATQNFNENNLLGSGSFGCVYKGMLADGMIIAVKVFNVQMEGTFQTFDRECEILRNLRHRNLTKIVSSCCNLDFKALILEYMPNESLEKLLYSLDYCLHMMQRLNIMVDVASALEYLHHGYSVPVIHCDVKPSNVLLDNDMMGHLTDFGIAKLLTKEESIAQTTTFATIGYIAPEYGLEGLISKRSDVYSFGIMLLETFTKKKPSDEKFAGDLNLRSWVHNSLPEELDQIIDADLLTVDEQNLSKKLQCVSSIMELAMNCTTSIPVERMNMTDVVETLNKIKQKLSFCY